MTKDTEEISQFTDSVACREYTLSKDENSSELEGWIRGNSKIGPVLEITICCLQGKYGVEIRIESMNKDNSHSWVRISRDLNKLVTNLNKEQDDNEKETSEKQFEDYELKSNARANASPSKAKAKPQRRTSASSSTKTRPISNHKIFRPPIIQCQRNWSIFFVMVVHFEKIMERLKDHLRIHFSRHWPDEKWKSIMAEGGGKQEKISVLYWFFMRNSLLSVVRSNTPSWIQDWYREDKNWAKENRQYSSRLWIPFLICVKRDQDRVPLDCDDPANQDLLLQRKRIEKLSQQDRVIKFCMNAGFLNVVEIGQNFMSQDTAEFSQFRAAACREWSIATKRLDPREHQNWTRIGSCNLLFARQIWSWDQNHVHEQRQFSLLGQNFSWLKQVCHEFEQHWAGNFRSAFSKNMRWNWMRVTLHSDQRTKQNHKDENLPVLPQEQYLLEKECGPMLNQENIQSPMMQCWRN